MTESRPHFSEYVTARMITVSVAIFTLFSFLLYGLIADEVDAYLAIFLLALALMIVVLSLHKLFFKMEKKLQLINHYLEKIDKMKVKEPEKTFFIKEFEEINQNLFKVLKSSKKREDIKQRYNAKLKLKNRQRADMISAISHEFRNPIASIIGYAQTLEDDKNIPIELQEKFLNKIYNNSLKIEALLSRLILWNKFESKEAKLEKSSFNLYLLAQEVKVELEEKYSQRVIVLEGSDAMVEADRTLIDIVLKNLVENGLKYSDDDIIVQISSNKVSIIDKGLGIDAQELSKITKKFYRSHTHSWDNSMGLGLAIVKNILLLHKSKLEVKSEKGKGSTFSFDI